jgi:general secretion pathway protein E
MSNWFSNLFNGGAKNAKAKAKTSAKSNSQSANVGVLIPTGKSARNGVGKDFKESLAAAGSNQLVIPQNEDGKVRYYSGTIGTQDALDGLRITSILKEAIQLAPSLHQHIALVSIDQTKKCLLLLSSNYKNSTEITEVVKLLAHSGYSLHEGRANAYIVSDELMLSLSRGDITPTNMNVRRIIAQDPRKSRLWTGFINIITWAHSNNASDVTYVIKTRESHSQIWFTIEGKYQEPSEYLLPTQTLLDQLGVAYQHSGGGQGAGFIYQIEQDCQIFITLNNGKKVMLRWSSMAGDDGPAVTLRILDLNVELSTTSLVDLGYLPSHISAMDRAMRAEQGAVILSGVMASGKSTTLATVTAGIPRFKKVITLESPVEYKIPNAIQMSVTDEEWKSKLRAIKRSGGHVFLLGEIRDLLTGTAYQDLTQSGLDLLTTTHAGRAINIPNRLSSPFIGVSPDVLATPRNMKLLVSQALLPKNCELCKLPIKSLIDPKVFQTEEVRRHGLQYLTRLERLYSVDLNTIYIRNQEGCPACRREGMPSLNGLKGRTVACEVFEPTHEFLSMVQNRRSLEIELYYENLRRADFLSADMFGKSAMECAVYKMTQGLIDPREIEPRFESFETVEINRKDRAKTKRATYHETNQVADVRLA